MLTQQQIQQFRVRAQQEGYSPEEIEAEIQRKSQELGGTEQAPQSSTEGSTGQDKGFRATDLLPIAGGIIGGIGGTLLAPGAGTILGGGVGSSTGEALRQMLEGEEIDPLAVGREGVLGALPVGKVLGGVGKVAKFGGKAAGRALDLAIGTEGGTVARAFTRPQAVQAAIKGETSIMPIVQQSRTALKNLDEVTNKEYGEAFNTLTKGSEKVRIPLSEVRDNLLNTLNKYGAKVTQPTKEVIEETGVLGATGQPITKIKNILGKVSFDRSAISDSREITGLQGLIKDINTWDDYSIRGINTLKQRMQNAFRPTASNRYNAIVTDLSNNIDELLTAKVPNLGKINAEFGAKRELIKALEKKLENAGAEGQLSNLFGRNKVEVQELFRELEKLSGKEILEAIKDIKAGQSLSGVFPATGSRTLDIIRGLGISGLGAAGGFAVGNVPGAIAGAAATSPRVVGSLVTGAGRLAQKIPQSQLAQEAIQQTIGQPLKRGVTSAFFPQESALQGESSLPKIGPQEESTSPPNIASGQQAVNQATENPFPAKIYAEYVAKDPANRAYYKQVYDAYQEAYGGGNDKPLSGPNSILLNKAQTSVKSVDRISQVLKNNPNLVVEKALNPLSQEGRLIGADVTSAIDILGYFRTGAAITKEQRADYIYMFPSALDRGKTASIKLQRLREELQGYADGLSKAGGTINLDELSPQMQAAQQAVQGF